MQPLIFSSHYLKQQYNEFMYLGSYFRWNVSKNYHATGSRSPLDGKQYTNANGRDHHAIYKAGQTAMAKGYFQRAAALRKEIEKRS